MCGDLVMAKGRSSGFKQGKPDPMYVHWGFMAESNGQVDEFYRAVMSAGARDNISPRARVEY